MINKLISFAKKSKYKNTFKSIYRKFSSIYPFVVANEMNEIKNVLASGDWNMANPDGIHTILEKEFSEYIGVKHAIVVNTGGMAIQMALRVLDIEKGDEVIHQVDTCVANAFAVMNASATPIFADISLDTFKLDFTNLDKLITPNTKAIMPIHLWGNSEDMGAIKDFAIKHNLKVIEDCALAFGTEYKGEKVGKFGDIGIFSFGSTKPIQAGEGGIIVTNSDENAKKLRAMRMWGEMTQEYGIRDHEILSWNGRTSEIVVALMLEQFRGYEKRIKKLHKNIEYFCVKIQEIKALELIDTNNYNTRASFAQLVFKLSIKIDKSLFMKKLEENRIIVWHANFELIPSISFFKNATWEKWSDSKNIDFVRNNYKSEFKNSKLVYEKLGIGLMPNNFSTMKRTKHTLHSINKILKEMYIK